MAGMEPYVLLQRARRISRMSQRTLAGRAGTSQPALAAYERGRVSPTLATTERILDAAGFRLAAMPRVVYSTQVTKRGRPFVVPDRLPQLVADRALARVTLPLDVQWSEPGRSFDLRDRAQRRHVYQLVLQEGDADDIEKLVDGALLVDLWDDMHLPREIHAAWTRVIDGGLGR